jgi:acyl carrier protein
MEHLTTELGLSREALESKSLDELGVDSLEIAELAMELENEYETRK